MKRFSQRNSLVTLNEINITPLLDLAFVLLIIFVITRPLLEGHFDLQLPRNMGTPDAQNINPSDIRRVEITPRGNYWLQGRQLTLAQIEGDLARTHRQNPKLVVYIAADGRAAWNPVAAMVNACTRNGITRVSFKTTPAEHP
jgi:biopolymer transport protein ExbD